MTRVDTTTVEPLRFTWRELSGSLGDLGTFLPLVLGMSLTCGFDLGTVLVWAGLLNVLSGWWLRQPIPVQPMKAIAAVAITERLLRQDLVAGGLLMGAALIILGAIGAVPWVARHVPRPVVRGIQLGIGLKLAVTALGWLHDLPWVGLDCVGVAAVFAVLLVLSRDGLRPLHWFRGVPVLLVFFAAGFLLLYLANPQAYSALHIAWPQFALTWPTDMRSWATGLTKVAVPQLPLTLLNSVVAVCALSADYFPGRGIPPGRMAMSVGAMNLVSVPFGGIPMCHGAGGLAAQHRFGARTGGSVVMLGVLKVAAGLVFGASLTAVLNDYPKSILAVMLVFAGASLASAARDCLRGVPLLVLAVTTATILLTNTAAGVVVGLVAAQSAAVAAGSAPPFKKNRPPV